MFTAEEIVEIIRHLDRIATAMERMSGPAVETMFGPQFQVGVTGS